MVKLISTWIQKLIEELVLTTLKWDFWISKNMHINYNYFLSSIYETHAMWLSLYQCWKCNCSRTEEIGKCQQASQTCKCSHRHFQLEELASVIDSYQRLWEWKKKWAKMLLKKWSFFLYFLTSHQFLKELSWWREENTKGNLAKSSSNDRQLEKYTSLRERALDSEINTCLNPSRDPGNWYYQIYLWISVGRDEQASIWATVVKNHLKLVNKFSFGF